MTSGFKSEVAKDIKRVFLNTLEFAGTHNINGALIPAVIDADVLKERMNPTSSQYVDGVFYAQSLVFVSMEDMPIKPVINELFELDGDMYLVIDVVENIGMLEITIQANRTI